jgi:uncharacterized protein YndB with AHSA1/START domain
LAICENLYNGFALRRQNIISNTTCPCTACSNVGNLDLKIIAHYGRFDEMKVGPVSDISGADVILVHRMTKTDVTKDTGVRSYALFSDAAAEAMDLKEALEPFSQEFEHFGEVSMQVFDLARAWETLRSERERFFLEEEDGVWTYRRHFNAPMGVVWELLVDPKLKERWMDSVSTVAADNQIGRVGNGSTYHCAHELAEFIYRITDWEPFSYFSTRLNDPARPGIDLPETYHLTETDTGTELRYTFGKAHDADGNRSKVSEEEAEGFLAGFWKASFDEMAAQIDAAN